MTPPVDRPIEELLPEMDALAALGALCFLKWTCPKCGDRCAADQPNAYHTFGYFHSIREDGSHCGTPYTGKLFGMMVVMADMPASVVLEMMAKYPEMAKKMTIFPQPKGGTDGPPLA